MEKRVIVTGASSGIGKGIVQFLHKEGYQVVACGRNEQALEALRDELKNNIFIFKGDLQKSGSISNLVNFAKVELSGIDVLICAAGITEDSLSVRMKDDAWNNVLNINLSSTFFLNREVLKVMLKQRSTCKIINFSSVIGITGNAGQANYAASKAGIIGFTKSLALEFAPKNITINVIAPGFIKTPMTNNLTDSQKDTILQKIPMNRLVEVEDVLEVVKFLLNADYVTGTVVHVNGGLLM